MTKTTMTPVKYRGSLLRKLVITGGVICLFVVAGSYAAFQARFLIAGPQIELTDEPAVVQEDRQIELRGVANNITAIYLNGRPIVTTEDGHFSESVVLENGYTTLHLFAEDRFGRMVDVERHYVYTGPGSVFYQ